MIEKLKQDIEDILFNKRRIRSNKLKRILGETDVEPIPNYNFINKNELIDKIDNLCLDLCKNQITDYRVVSDDSNNSEYTINTGYLLVDVYVQPINNTVKVINIAIKNNDIIYF